MTTSRLHKYMLSSFVTQTHHCMEHTFTMEVTSTTIGPSQRKRSQKNDEEDDLPKKRPKKSPKLLKGDLTNLVCRMCTSTLRRGKIRKPYRMCKICGKEYCMTCKKNEMSRCNICRKKVCKDHIIKKCLGIPDKECGKAFCCDGDCCGNADEETCINCEGRRLEMGYYEKGFGAKKDDGPPRRYRFMHYQAETCCLEKKIQVTL